MNETRFLNETVHKLNGQIRMVLGNHDNDVKAYAKCNKIKKIHKKPSNKKLKIQSTGK